MREGVLLPEGGYYKANLHCHSTVSDGKLTPEELKAAYLERGYSIVAFTDHRKYRWHKELTDEKFLALAALEADLNEGGGRHWSYRRAYHLNLLDTDPTVNAAEKEQVPMPDAEYGDMDGLNEYIARMNELGFLVVYNHPYWSLQTHEDYAGLKGLLAMEIYNHGNETGMPNGGMYGFQPQTYDEMLRAKQPTSTGQALYAIAADDDHNFTPFDDPFNDSFGGFVQIAAKELTYPAVMEALKAGEFYWSMGPEIKGVSIRNGVLAVDTSPVEKIFVMQESRKCYHAAVLPGQTLTHAEFPLTGEEGWVRVQVRDGRGCYAGTNAYFI